MRARLIVSIPALAVITACAAYRIDPAELRPLPPPTGEPGECEPPSYVLPSGASYDADLRIIFDDQGHALQATVNSAPDYKASDSAVDLAKHVFTCAHPLTQQAPRVIPSWKVEFRPMETPHPVDLADCRSKVRYPRSARREGLEATVRLRVAIDEQGNVRRAWSRGTDTTGFLQAGIAAVEQCRFTPAVSDGKPVATAFAYDVDFVLNR
jgi:TonB family protein